MRHDAYPFTLAMSFRVNSLQSSRWSRNESRALNGRVEEDARGIARVDTLNKNEAQNAGV
jgi:hypothetical protein